MTKYDLVDLLRPTSIYDFLGGAPATPFQQGNIEPSSDITFDLAPKSARAEESDEIDDIDITN